MVNPSKDDNSFTGKSGTMAMNKNPLQFSVNIAQEEQKKREAALAGFQEVEENHMNDDFNRNYKSKAAQRINR